MLSFLSDEDDESKSKDKEIKDIESKIQKVEALKAICDVFTEKYKHELSQKREID